MELVHRWCDWDGRGLVLEAVDQGDGSVAIVVSAKEAGVDIELACRLSPLAAAQLDDVLQVARTKTDWSRGRSGS